MSGFLSPLGFVQHAHTPAAIAAEIERVRAGGDEVGSDLVSAAIERAFRLGQVDARRAAAHARRVHEGESS